MTVDAYRSYPTASHLEYRRDTAGPFRTLECLMRPTTTRVLLVALLLMMAAAGPAQATGSMATPRLGHTATLLADGPVLVVGGLGGVGEVLASVDVYDPATGAFSLTASLATGRYAHTATRLADGTVLIAGGFGDAGYLASVEVYGPATGTFAPT